MDILVAEDDQNFGSFLKLELESDGHVVELVADGVEAIAQTIKQVFAVILLDLRMPLMNGNSALKIIKMLQPDVPVITFSGNAGRAEMQESMALGAMQCLAKPFRIADLKDLLSSLP
jgi:CheY-like chemotaxis protein